MIHIIQKRYPKNNNVVLKIILNFTMGTNWNKGFGIIKTEDPIASEISDVISFLFVIKPGETVFR